MTDKNKQNGNGVIDILKMGLSYVSEFITASIVPSITQGADIVLTSIENRLLILEKRIVRNIQSSIVIGLGILCICASLLFYLIQQIGLYPYIAFIIIGIPAVIFGLILKIHNNER
jgi:hypothetical protein